MSTNDRIYIESIVARRNSSLQLCVEEIDNYIFQKTIKIYERITKDKVILVLHDSYKIKDMSMFSNINKLLLAKVSKLIGDNKC